MLPTFIIGLREGVEASLIVGILAAFLVKQGRRDVLRAMWIGVVLAVGLCLAFGIGLEVVNANLPQQQQEGLETVVALVAVGVVTYMIVWMRRHAREMKGQLESHAGAALASGSAKAFVGMAFFAVVREGFETAVFLVAAFQSSSDPTASGAGALLGIVCAVVIGALLYRGGIRINLAKFFRGTGAVLVLVAAGLVASAIHTAHEATWFNGLQTQAMDISWLVAPGSVRGALLTGMLGLQPQPTVGETIGWVVYAGIVLTYVLWPQKRTARPTALSAQTKAEAPVPA